MIPELFPVSCAIHDSCYESGNPKGVCDDVFKKNMWNEAGVLAKGNVELIADLLAAANTYYEAVTHSDAAFEEFCEATPNPGEHAECDPELQSFLSDNIQHTNQTTGGLPTGGIDLGLTNGYGSLGDGFIVTYECELWQFPDGNGGHYIMSKNCTYSYN